MKRDGIGGAAIVLQAISVEHWVDAIADRIAIGSYYVGEVAGGVVGDIVAAVDYPVWAAAVIAELGISQDAVGKGHRGTVIDAAAFAVRRAVAKEGAVRDSRRCGCLGAVKDGAAEVRGVSRQGAVDDGQRTVVIDGAALV